MSRFINIALPNGGKAKIYTETHLAILRAIRIYDCDRRVSRYAAAPHEGITPEIVAAIRRKVMDTNELPSRSFSRRHERHKLTGPSGRSWRAPLANSGDVA